ncbi:helix-turn-helix transcriptional regulator [Subtercola endophyticus]|uniref:helix-turn-helix transcriptional regulator n=1 Tax=Subtercola endophyticus TaxID=2895559 RepID=UPI001E4C71DC|nr:helix-turn-helix domain-containing protein [Subtercola endophyticus]UFS60532.1 helix-turn-helix domain-containing protein [Subtercola endophyticus]
MTSLTATPRAERLVALVTASLHDLGGVAEASELALSMSDAELHDDLDAVAAHIVLSSMPGSTVELDPTLGDLIIRAVRADTITPQTALRVAAAIRALSNRGTPQPAVALIDRCREAFAEPTFNAHDSTAAAWLPSIAAVWLTGGLALQLLHQNREAFDLFTRAATPGNPDYLRYLGLGYVALGLSLSGQLPAAKAPAEAALAVIAEHGWPPHQNRIPVLAALVLVNTGLLRFSEARESFDELARVLEIAEPQWRFAALEVQVLYWCLSGQAASAVTHLERVSLGFEIDSASPAVRAQIVYSSALVEVFLGRPGVVIGSTAEYSGLPAHQICFESLRGFSYLALGLPRSALESISSCLALGPAHSPSTATALPLIQAAAAQLTGDQEAALAHFARWTGVASSGGYSGAALLAPSVLAELLAESEAAESEAAESEVGQYGAVPDGVRRLTVDSPNRLEEVYRTIGKLTPAERSLLTRLRGTETLSQIGEATFTSRNTVKSHVRNLTSKLGVGSRAGAVDLAEVAGWFALKPSDR